MQRIIIRRKDDLSKTPTYDFLGDFDYGVWSSDLFKVYPAVLLKMPGVVWIDELIINGKMICWPYVESIDKKSLSILKYKEHVKFNY